MRIGFDATILAPATRYSGIGQYAFKLLRHLAELDQPHQYVLYGHPDTRRPSGLPAAMRWRPLPRLPLGKLSYLATYLWVLPRLATADGLDLFHAPTAHPRPSWPPLPRRLPCPLTVTLHDLIPLTFYSRGSGKMPWRMRLFYRWNLRAAAGAARVITVSEASRREILTELKLGPDRLVTIYNGVEDPGTLQDGADPVPGAGPYALFVGSYEPRKNLPGLLRAYAAAVKRGFTPNLVVSADPASGQAADVRAQVAALGLEKRVRFVHGLSEARLWSLYRQAQLFVFPSLAEGFGLPPLESMAAGTSVIASDIPALREVLGDAAHFVDPRDDDGLTGALLQLDAAPASRQRLAEAGRRQAAQYRWRDCAKNTQAVYEAAAERAAAGGYAPDVADMAEGVG